MIVIVGLVVLNGLFSMSELAIVSARPARLKVEADKGRTGARIALELTADPGKFLSTVQSGITLVGVVAGAFSGVHFGGPIGERLAALGVPARLAPDAGFVLAVVATTYLNLVVGELVPKQIALQSAEAIAIVSAGPMAVFARAMAPLVWVLNRSSGALLRLLGVRITPQPEVTEEELHVIFAEATRSGVIEEEERAIMTGIMRLADRPVREMMTPRIEIVSIDRQAGEAEIRARLRDCPHSLLPVVDGSPDTIVGVAKVREMQTLLLDGLVPDLGLLMRKAEVIPDQLDAMDALRILQRSDVAMALVHDEYGHLEGLVTPADLLAAIAGDFASYLDDGEGPMVVEREDGSLLVSGAMPADALADRLKLHLPEDRDYATAAGFVLSVLKRLPDEGDHFHEQDWRFEVVDMDGRKIDKLLVSRVAPKEE